MLNEHEVLVEQLEALETDSPDDVVATMEIRHALQELRARYVDSLPMVPLSRSPNGHLLSRPFDAEGLDGLFWDYQWPARAFASPAEGCIALDGAMQLNFAELASAPFLASPGAATPAVVPDLLVAHQAQAVLSSVRVGAHAGFVVSYFSKAVDPSAPLLNEWGAAEHWRSDVTGDWVRAHRAEHDVTRDFDLTPWIASGHLQWIAPGDDTWTLHDTIEGCPYLDLEGRRARQYVQFGELWFDEEPHDGSTLTER